MTRNIKEHWFRLRIALLPQLESFSAHLSDNENKLLRDFIDNREFGVALESLYSIVRDRGIQISPQQETQFYELAELMGVVLGKMNEE